MMQPLLLERVDERAHDVLLPDERRERAGTPLAGEHLIRHGRDSSPAVSPSLWSLPLPRTGEGQFARDALGGEPCPRHLQ